MSSYFVFRRAGRESLLKLIVWTIEFSNSSLLFSTSFLCTWLASPLPCTTFFDHFYCRVIRLASKCSVVCFA